MTSSCAVTGATVEDANATPIYFPRYVVAIGGTQLLAISDLTAKKVFRRWSEQPDVLVRGDLLTGFCWQWPDRRRTKVMVMPLTVEAATPAQAGRTTDVEGVGIATAGSVAAGETPIHTRASQRDERSCNREPEPCGQPWLRHRDGISGGLTRSTSKFLADKTNSPRPRPTAQLEEVPPAMMIEPWAKGQSADGPVVPTILNCRLRDGAQYRVRQENRFFRGQFGYVPVTMVRCGDQVFPEFGCGPMRTVVVAGQVWRGQDYIIEVEHDPTIEPEHAKDATRHDPAGRVFARRPHLDTDGTGLECVELELPADIDSEGNWIDVSTGGLPARRYVALLTAFLRPRCPVDAVQEPEPVPDPHAAEEVGLGARPKDTDWLGRRRAFTADADMGVWERDTARAELQRTRP